MHSRLTWFPYAGIIRIRCMGRSSDLLPLSLYA